MFFPDDMLPAPRKAFLKSSTAVAALMVYCETVIVQVYVDVSFFMNNMILVNYKTHLFKAFGEDTPVFYISKASLTAVLLSKAKLFFSIFLPAANVTM